MITVGSTNQPFAVVGAAAGDDLGAGRPRLGDRVALASRTHGASITAPMKFVKSLTSPTPMLPTSRSSVSRTSPQRFDGM